MFVIDYLCAVLPLNKRTAIISVVDGFWSYVADSQRYSPYSYFVIPHFGTFRFTVRQKKAALARNPATGEVIRLPAGRKKGILSFRSLNAPEAREQLDSLIKTNSSRWQDFIKSPAVDERTLSVKRRIITDIAQKADLDCRMVDVVLRELLMFMLRVFAERKLRLIWAKRGVMGPIHAWRGRNPVTGEHIKAPAGRFYCFRPFKTLKLA